MKKVYTKPELFCEEYELSVAIAGNCAEEFFGVPNASTVDKCTFEMMGKPLFTEANPSCKRHPIDGEMFCYMTPTDTTRIFAS